MGKKLWVFCRFDIKPNRCFDKADNETFKLSFTNFPFIVIGKKNTVRFYMQGSLLSRQKSCNLFFRLGDIMYFDCVFKCPLRLEGATLVRSSPLWKSCNESIPKNGAIYRIICNADNKTQFEIWAKYFAKTIYNIRFFFKVLHIKSIPKCKLLLQSDKLFLNYWPLNNVVFTFYERNSAALAPAQTSRQSCFENAHQHLLKTQAFQD